MTEQVVDDHDLGPVAGDAPAPAPTADRRRRTLTCIVFLLPSALFLALGVRPLEPLNGQDGYLYTGMVPRMYDFLNRFPDAYYGVRFGYTLPTWVATKAFGFEVGYLGLRLALIGAICVILSRRLRPGSAMLATAVVSTSPIVMVAAFNTYTLSVGVLTFVMGAVVLSTTDPDSRSLTLRASAAGALFATSWNAHLVVLPLCLAITGLFLGDHLWHAREHRLRAAVRLGVAVGVGAMLVTVIGVVVYGTQFDLWDVYGPSLDQARRPTENFYLEPGWRWVGWRHYLWVGPLAVAGGALAWRSESDPTLRRTARRLTAFTAISFALFASFQWLQDDPLLATYFYSALPLTLGVATLAFASAVIVNRTTRLDVFPAFALAALVPTTLVVASSIGGRFAFVTTLAIVTGVVAVTFAVRSRGSAITGIALVLVAASWATVSSPHDFRATPGGFRTDPYYDGVLFSYDWGTLDRAQLVDEFARSLPSLPDDRGAMRVWFDTALPYDQLSAPLAWRRSALNGPQDPPPPEVTASIRSALLDDRPRFVVIIDGQQLDAEQGAAQVAAIAPYSIVWQRRLTEGPLVAHAILLERASGTWPDFPCRTDAGEAENCTEPGS